MNNTWKRPELDVRAPDRSFGNALRAAQAAGGGDGITGVPLQTVTDAVVATVRLGYRVADREIERGRRMGQRLREGAERAGIADPEQWVQQAERLFGRGLTGSSEWVDAWSKDLVHLLGADPQLLRLLGHEGALAFAQDSAGLHVTLPDKAPGEHAFAFRIEGVS